ncbi:MAG TPA: sigma-54 dependent transcriptional regulator [Geothermobacteraceae bacterium]|nr:sigma-54 dependent transcriptional regulator [Geothermobacteraceae bacterium]
MAKESILVIDDDDSLRKVIEFTLRQEGHQVVACSSGKEGLQEFTRTTSRVVITDVQLGDMSGYDVLRIIKNEQPETQVIVITAFGSVENAVEAMKLGAYDYLSKPFSCDQLRIVAAKAVRSCSLQDKQSSPQKKPEDQKATSVIGHSDKLLAVMDQARKVAASHASVLILGESGTGKELVARAIHEASPRAKGPFVAVNCAAIPKELMESELFGHVKGAFTGAIKDRSGKFQSARGGTLFLDEVGELPLDLQPKLLRALQERVVEQLGGAPVSVDVRVVAATNIDIETAVGKGTFREDLYYRLAVVPLTLPALRHRREDIPLLFNHFVEKYGNGAEITVTTAAMDCLRNYDWPGNVRELENVVERTLILCPAPVIEENHLPPRIRLNSEIKSRGVLNLPEQGYSLVELEKEAVMQALLRNDWNQSRAAEFLQIPRHVLLYRMEKYGLKR